MTWIKKNIILNTVSEPLLLFPFLFAHPVSCPSYLKTVLMVLLPLMCIWNECVKGMEIHTQTLISGLCVWHQMYCVAPVPPGNATVRQVLMLPISSLINEPTIVAGWSPSVSTMPMLLSSGKCMFMNYFSRALIYICLGSSDAAD